MPTVLYLPRSIIWRKKGREKMGTEPFDKPAKRCRRRKEKKEKIQGKNSLLAGDGGGKRGKKKLWGRNFRQRGKRGKRRGQHVMGLLAFQLHGKKKKKKGKELFFYRLGRKGDRKGKGCDRPRFCSGGGKKKKKKAACLYRETPQKLVPVRAPGGRKNRGKGAQGIWEPENRTCSKETGGGRGKMAAGVELLALGRKKGKKDFSSRPETGAAISRKKKRGSFNRTQKQKGRGESRTGLRPFRRREKGEKKKRGKSQSGERGKRSWKRVVLTRRGKNERAPTIPSWSGRREKKGIPTSGKK